MILSKYCLKVRYQSVDPSPIPFMPAWVYLWVYMMCLLSTCSLYAGLHGTYGCWYVTQTCQWVPTGGCLTNCLLSRFYLDMTIQNLFNFLASCDPFLSWHRKFDLILCLANTGYLCPSCCQGQHEFLCFFQHSKKVSSQNTFDIKRNFESVLRFKFHTLNVTHKLHLAF